MGIPISLKEVASELDGLSDEWTAYINRETGELYTVTEIDSGAADDDLDEDEELPDWEKESIAKVREIESSDAWIALPGKFEINEWDIMRRFAESQTNEEIADTLARAIRGTGAFRYFKDTISDLGIREQWFAFKQKALEDIAREALKAAGIPFKEP